MDKFSASVLKVLSYIFLLSAVACLILWISEEDTYSHPATSWVIWVSGILTSLFFSAVSHTVARVIERIHKEEYYTEDYSSNLPAYDSEGNQIN